MSDRCFSCRGPRCPSHRATRTEHGQPFWPSCDLHEGHDGRHQHGHVMEALWVWDDAEAMTADELAAWEAGAA